MTNLNDALELIEANSSTAFLAGPKSPELIAKAEAALGTSFPPSYREFVLKLGCGSIAGREFFGITTDNFENASVPNGIWLTLDERKSSGLPHHLIIVYALGEGTYYALDMSRRSSSGECPVVAWPIGATCNDQLEVIAEDFGQFLLNTLESALS